MNPSQLSPRHEVQDESKLADLVAGMIMDGWQGRPLLVVDNGTMRCLTGSHRLAAAREAGLVDVPAVVVPWETWEAASADSRSVERLECDDSDLLMAFMAVSEMEGAQEAIDLLTKEIG